MTYQEAVSRGVPRPRRTSSARGANRSRAAATTPKTDSCCISSPNHGNTLLHCLLLAAQRDAGPIARCCGWRCSGSHRKLLGVTAPPKHTLKKSNDATRRCRGNLLCCSTGGRGGPGGGGYSRTESLGECCTLREIISAYARFCRSYG